MSLWRILLYLFFILAGRVATTSARLHAVIPKTLIASMIAQLDSYIALTAYSLQGICGTTCLLVIELYSHELHRWNDVISPRPILKQVVIIRLWWQIGRQQPTRKSYLPTSTQFGVALEIGRKSTSWQTGWTEPGSYLIGNCFLPIFPTACGWTAGSSFPAVYL